MTVWDLNRYGPNDFLGEVLLDLDSVMMNHEPNWYTLTLHEESAGFHVSLVPYLKNYYYGIIYIQKKSHSKNYRFKECI